MSQTTWPRECVHCKEKVEYKGEDLENSGFGPCKRKRGKHEVESKTYYHFGARDMQDGRDRRKFSPTIILVPVYERVVGDKRIQTKGLSVQFSDGKLETSDPEVQFYLEEKLDIGWGDSGLKTWQEIYLTPQQQNDLAQAELANTKRQIAEANDLLEQMKRQKGAKVSA